MSSFTDRCLAVLKDFKNNEVNSTTTADIELIAMEMSDKWDAMTLLRRYGAAYFAFNNKMPEQTKLVAIQTLTQFIHQITNYQFIQST
jgi:hypothetical protein